ncbi:MAG: Uma2 family endonuclease [Myxococcales bacterium]|nr:Uma2 family endonuclease [Myxococcales bacterium]
MGTLELREPRPRLFKPEEYLNLVELGTFENERVELIRGVIIRMSPLSVFHDDTVMKLDDLLKEAYGRKRAWVRVQMTFASVDSRPQPDLVCIDRNLDCSKAQPKEAFLIVEVADSSLKYDTTIKAELYAEAGVPEYWVVDLKGKQIEVRTEPKRGAYTTMHLVGFSERIAVPGTKKTLRVSDFLTPKR